MIVHENVHPLFSKTCEQAQSVSFIQALSRDSDEEGERGGSRLDDPAADPSDPDRAAEEKETIKWKLRRGTLGSFIKVSTNNLGC